MKRANLDAPWECSFYAFKDYDSGKVAEHEKYSH